MLASNSHSPRQQGQGQGQGPDANMGSLALQDVNLASAAPRHSPTTSAALEFADIPHSGTDDASHVSSSLLHPDSLSSSSADPLPLPGAAAPAPASNASFWQLAFYQRFFDVTTSQLGNRMLRAVVPFVGPAGSGGKFYHDEDPNPDLYGPFWLTTTLIFLLAAAGNFANYIQFIIDMQQQGSWGDAVAGGNATVVEPTAAQTLENMLVWSYDFAKVSTAASVFYCWISIVPLLVFCAFSRIGAEEGAPQKGLVEIASIFGYGLVTLLPVCILCIPPIPLLRWIAVAASFLWSSAFLIKNLGVDINKKAVVPVIAGVVLLNFGLALLTKFYFFDF